MQNIKMGVELFFCQILFICTYVSLEFVLNKTQKEKQEKNKNKNDKYRLNPRFDMHTRRALIFSHLAFFINIGYIR